MNDFNEDVTNILNSIKSLYKGCEGIECEDCVVCNAKDESIEMDLCDFLFRVQNEL